MSKLDETADRWELKVVEWSTAPSTKAELNY